MKINKNTTLVVLISAAFIQLVIITYNHITGFINITDTSNFFIRFFIGTSFSFIFAFILLYIDIKIINQLDASFPLPQKLLARIPAELIFAVIAGIIIGSAVTIIAGVLMPYDDGLVKNIINNSLITSVLNIIMITIIEAVLWFRRTQASHIKTEKLERENSQIRFETLKSQLNPHFLFNSLNVLSSLIRKDPDKAETFVNEFASVYRYTLDVIEQPVVSLQKELDFARSFLYLQRIRFGDAVDTEINVDVSKLGYFVPPLAVQTLLENSFKHNKASADVPLKINIFDEGDKLIIKNNLNLKTRGVESKGVGLSNLIKRYELLGDDKPEFKVTGNEYISKIPLLKSE